MENLNKCITEYQQQLAIGNIQKAYKSIIKYMMTLKTQLENENPIDFITGHFYQGYMDFTYFTFTPVYLKEKKLKIAIIFNHEQMRFEAWLVGQNKQIQKKYCQILKDTKINKYSVYDNQLSIIDTILVTNPDFNNTDALTNKIKSGTMVFIYDMVKMLK